MPECHHRAPQRPQFSSVGMPVGCILYFGYVNACLQFWVTVPNIYRQVCISVFLSEGMVVFIHSSSHVWTCRKEHLRVIWAHILWVYGKLSTLDVMYISMLTKKCQGVHASRLNKININLVAQESISSSWVVVKSHNLIKPNGLLLCEQVTWVKFFLLASQW